VFENIFPQLIGLCAGALLLTSALMVWRHSLLSSIRWLAAQGIALAALVAVIGLQKGEAELIVVSLLILAVKGLGLPWVLAHRSKATTRTIDESPRLNPTAALLVVALLTILSYVVSYRLLGRVASVPAHAAPIGLAMVLIGFLLLVTRRRARSQLAGFLLLDNGIATVAFLTSGGVPLLLEFGISLDVLMVVLILYVFAGRMRTKFGGTDIDQLRELHD
jgi:hydrogenase-4 component E